MPRTRQRACTKSRVRKGLRVRGLGSGVRQQVFLRQSASARKRIIVTNNDILKKLRIALELKDTDIIEILRLADFEVSTSEVNALFRNPENKNYRECGDQLLRRFLDGLIIQQRGPRRRRLVRTIQKPGA